jgi:hypothetical protein
MVSTTPAIVGCKTLALRFTFLAQYRLQSRGLESELGDIFKDTKRVAAVCNWIWAMDTLKTYATPEDVAEAIGPQEVSAAMDALLDAFLTAHPKSESGDGEKKSPRKLSKFQKRG